MTNMSDRLVRPEELRYGFWSEASNCLYIVLLSLISWFRYNRLRVCGLSSELYNQGKYCKINLKDKKRALACRFTDCFQVKLGRTIIVMTTKIM